ncbi:MAG: winged helix-turn-helix transcriptional regulator [Candidatus Competibacteraceae bacterium]|nr:winged helix-turn-helix transcriptional regulator [Candidatus Competibacteraceae bacterium]
MQSQFLQFKADFFKALANPLRLRIIEQLKAGPMTVSELNEKLQAEPTNLSQQLAVLKSKNILLSEKKGINVIYSCADPEIFAVMNSVRRVFDNHLRNIKGMLDASQSYEE